MSSTAMRARLGDVEADRLRRRHDELLRTSVTRCGGTVVKGLGDGILAAFGASAEAAKAATEIQRDIDRSNQQSRDDHRIGLRIGISAGDVSWEDGDCYGTPVITAARLCDTAEGGQILCDDLVRGLVRGHTELSFTLIGEAELKGLPEPVLAYELKWESFESASASASMSLPAPLRHQAGQLPFAARADERLQLAEAWKRAQVDRATTVLLAGEPGIGKTRIASEIARQAHSEGALVVLGRCDEHLTAPHAPWSELLRTVVAEVGDAPLLDHVGRKGGEIARIAPELLRHVPDAPPPAMTDPDTERLLLFDAVVDLLQVAAVNQPLVILLDDAHWADTGSVHLLRHVVSHVDPDTHLLILVTYRDTDIDRSHPLSGALADLYRSAGTERIALRGLDETDMIAFLEAAGGHPLQAEGVVLAKRLASETDGNPFFVTEVLRHLVETGLIVQRDGQWVGTEEPGQTGLPEGVRDVIGQRLSRLSEETNDMLRTSAVVGREFELDLVAAVANVDPDEAGDALDKAVAFRLVDEVEGSPGRLSFAHALVRQTLLEELTTNKRVRLHRRIAELLDARRGTPVELLAHHYLEAAANGVAPRAIVCALKAAANAVARFAWEDALRLYDRMLEVVDLVDDDPGLRSEILALSAHSHHGIGALESARSAALEAAANARSAQDPVRLTAAGVAYQGELGMWESPSNMVGGEIIREGLDGLGPDHPDVRAVGLSALAHGLILAPGGALTEADEAVRAAREADDPQALTRALTVRAWAVRGTLPVAERLGAAEAAVAAAQAGDRPFEVTNALYHLANAYVNEGDLTRAEATFGAASDARGALDGWSVADYRASLATAQGRFSDAVRLSSEAHDMGAALGETNDGIYLLQNWNLARYTGGPEECQPWQERASANVIGAAIPLTAYSAFDAGDIVGARESLHSWMREIQPVLPAIMRYADLPIGARLMLHLDVTDWLEEWIAYGDRFAGELCGSDAAIIGAADAARGCLRAAQGDLDAAVPLLEAGHALHERLELPQLAVESGTDLATVLFRRDQPGDRDRAQAVLQNTIERAERIGMRTAGAFARALLS